MVDILDMPRILNLPKKYRNSLGYYPDILFYQASRNDYEEKLKELSKSWFIYSNGYNLEPVGLFTYLFQSFKGWLGFTNYCQPERVLMSLQKFAFFGHLRGYPQGQLNNLTSYGLSEEYIKLVSSPKSPVTSMVIQYQLIEYYMQNQLVFISDIRADQPRVSNTYGEPLAQLDLWEEIPKLDPQDPILIEKTIKQLEGETPNYSFFPNSRYAYSAAKCNIEKAKGELASNFVYQWVTNSHTKAQNFLERALSLAPKITNDEPELYIRYYKQIGLKSQAILLLKKLPPVQAFNYMISLDLYDAAYKLFNENQGQVFSKDDIQKLADYFSDLGESDYKKGRSHRDANIWDEATELYKSGLEAKKKAYDLEPNQSRKDEYTTYQRLYAQILIDSNIQSNIPSKYRIEEIDEAIAILQGCLPKDIGELKLRNTALAKGLLHKAQHLNSQLPTYPSLEEEDNINVIVQLLNEISELLKGTEDETQKGLLNTALILLTTFKPDNDLTYESEVKMQPRRGNLLSGVSNLLAKGFGTFRSSTSSSTATIKGDVESGFHPYQS